MKTDQILGNDVTGVNQILPHTNKWAWDLYLKGIANNWVPTEVRMDKDIKNWRSNKITPDEKLLIKRCLGFFAGSESLVGNNLVTMYRYIVDPECRQYISRQMFEENIHNHTLVYICDSLSLDINELYQAHESIPCIKEKDDFLMKIARDCGGLGFNINEPSDRAEFLKAAFGYWIICEGIFFTVGFASLLSMSELIPGISEQIAYTYRDEAIHVEFGTNLLNKIYEQNQDIIRKYIKVGELEQLVYNALELEEKYTEQVLPRGIKGLNKDSLMEYARFVTNARISQLNFVNIDLPAHTHKLTWMTEVIETQKMKNFFETRVTDYQSRGMLEDDF